MTYPNDHTPEQHRAALDSLRRDMVLVNATPHPCPECGTMMVYEGPTEGGDGRRYLPAWSCDHCGRYEVVEDDKEHNDE